MAQRIKRLPAMQETWVRSLGREDPLEKGKATHSSTLARRIPWTGAWRATGHGAADTRLSDFTVMFTLSPRGGGTEPSALRVTFILSECMNAQILELCLAL